MKIKPNVLFQESLLRLFCLTIFAATTILSIPYEHFAQVSNPGKSSLPDDSFKSDKTKRQNDESELPFSRVNEFIKPDPSKTVRLPRLTDTEKSATTNKKMRIGTVRKLEREITEFSQGTDFAVGGGTVWVFGIVSEGAVQTRLRFNATDLPTGAKLFVYSVKNPSEVYGPYENSGDAKNGDFWTPPVEGDGVVIEYYAPERAKSTSDRLPFKIVEVSHIYKDISGFQNGENISPPEFPCHNNVPAEWANVAKSVGQMQFTSGGGEYLCTGTLLNPVAGDFDPIFLTANHCISTEAEAQSLRVYWLYNSGDFPSASLPRSEGATLISTGTTTDYTLLRIRGAIPLLAGITYSGWEASNTPVGTAVAGIHHPRGSYKRFSTGTTATNGNFIRVNWNSGITEGGSSGSGIWKGTAADARLIGTLSGGTIGCTNPRDDYGNFAVTYQTIAPLLQGGTDDNYDAGSGNDSRQTAVNIALGTYANLIVKWQDSDWYAVNVPAGYKITATANFTHNFGDLDLALYKGAAAAPVAVSNTSLSNTETVTDTTNVSTTYYIRAYLFDGARNNYSLNVTLQQVAVVNRPRFDYDGDGKSDISVFRPSNSVWYLSNSSIGFSAVQFGAPGDLLAPADFDGDGRTDVAVFRPSNGTWFWLNSSNNTLSGVGFGANGDIPAPADYDGDEKADLTVFRPSSGTWFRLNSGSNNSFTAIQFGQSEDKPTIGDFDGDRKADIAVFRPSNSVWYRLNSGSGNSFFAVQFGASGDRPVPADYDGDGKTDVSVYRPSNSIWYRLNSSDNAFIGVGFGTAEDRPAPADYDGDGRADLAVFRPSNGTWFVQMSQSGFAAQQFGASEDTPTPAAFIR